jgi:hypothetical protein
MQNPTAIGKATFKYSYVVKCPSLTALAIEGDTIALSADPSFGKLIQIPNAIFDKKIGTDN